MKSLTVDKSIASANDARSQSTHQIFRRRFPCSAVPNSSLLTPLRRPDKGGSKGQQVVVYANHFYVDVEQTAVIYQYEIDVVTIGRENKTFPIRKDDRWEVIQTFLKQRKYFPTVW